MFDPPVSTPISRMQAMAASRMRWYSRSVRVCAGATVIESPVCTPMGSKFSMEQTMTTLSLRSRITSSSYSFQPAIDSSIRISEIMLASSPRAAISSNRAGSVTTPPPVPPRVNEGRMMSGKPMLSAMRPGLLQGVGEAAARQVDADPLHGLLEQLAVLRLADGLAVRADHPHAVSVEDALLRELDGDVQARLPAEGGQERVGSLRLDDLLQHGHRDGLDVGGVRHLGVRHDGGGIGVDQDDAHALLPQGLARLGPGIVELARLADDDGTGADDEDRMDVSSSGHGPRLPSMRSAKRAKR